MWKREPLEEDELQPLLDAAESTDLDHDVTCRTLVYTGLRANEFAHLNENWIDWQGERLRVPRESGDWSPKTEHSVRTIPVKEPSCLRVLREYFKRHSGISVSRQSVYSRVRRVARKTNLTKKVTPHVLRHTYGTMIASRGATPQYIVQTMGHADLSSATPYIKYSGSQLDSEAEELF